jgi:hypothetical protein
MPEAPIAVSTLVDPALAGRMAGLIDELRSRYPSISA